MEENKGQLTKELSGSLDLKSILALKKPVQVPLHSNPATTLQSNSPTMERRVETHKQVSAPIEPFALNTVEKELLEESNFEEKKAYNNTPLNKRLVEIRRSIQNDISSGIDQFGVLDALNNILLALVDETTYNVDSEESLRRYSDYFQLLSETLTGVRNKKTTEKSGSDNSYLNTIIEQAYPQVKRAVTPAKKLLIKFVAEEGDYVFELQRLIDEYLQAIQKEQLLSKADEKTIFSVGPELLEFHNSLYIKLKEALKAPDCEIGSILEEKLQQFSLYQQYSINAADAAQCLERNIKESKNLSNLIRQRDKKDSTLSTLIHRPLRRVEEYVFALDAYTKSLPPGTKDKSKVEDVRDHLQEILDAIEKGGSVADNLAKVMEIGNSIDGLDENLVRPDRRFIHEGPIKLFRPDNQKKPIADYSFLFNDVLIYCNASGKSYTYVGRLYMHVITFQESSKVNSIDVTVNEKEKYFFTAQSPADRDSWMLYLGKVIREVERTRKVFGVPLKVLMKREKESDIPVIVEKAIKFIYDYGIDKEGIFRQTGRSTQIEKLKDQLNQGAKVFFSENMDVHTVATLFKQWLRELPDPLLTWDSYSDFVMAIQQPEDVRDDILREIIEHLPLENRFVCQHMFKCLHSICENEAKTKMNPNNLAVVFAPNILKNADPNANPFDQTHFDRINDIFKTLITNYSNIFGSIELERGERKFGNKKAKEKENRRSIRMTPGQSNYAKVEEGQVIKEGILNYLNSKKKWQLRYITVKSLSIQIFGKTAKEKKPKLTLDLVGSQISSAPASGKPFSWIIETNTTPASSYCFAAKNSDEQDEWIKAIQTALLQ